MVLTVKLTSNQAQIFRKINKFQNVYKYFADMNYEILESMSEQYNAEGDFNK